MTTLLDVNLASPAPPASDLAAILSAYNDVTERLKGSHEMLAREVCRLREQIQEKDRELARRERLSALGEMAAGLAHEIRNPLAGISLYASLLERDLAGAEAPGELLRKIDGGIRKVDAIITDVLAFARGARPHRRTVVFGESIDRVRAQIHARAAEREVSVEVEDVVRNWPLHCDPTQIERVFSNLLLNAVEAVGPGGHVRVRGGEVDEDHELVRIRIEDDGPGVPESARARVFDPFFTTRETGTGLGLAIAHRIIDAHEGTIRVGASPEGGASFEVSLPRARSRESNEQGTAGKPTGSVSHWSGSQVTDPCRRGFRSNPKERS